MRTVRNILIIAVIALGVAFLPNGGNFADAVMTAITLGFLAAITWTVHRLVRSRQLLFDTLPDSRRAVLYAGAGLVVLMVAGAGSMVQSGPGTVAWIALFASGIALIWLLLSEARGT